MTPQETERKMREHLASGVPHLVRHAEARVALGFKPGPAPSAPDPPPPRFEPFDRVTVAIIKACPHRVEPECSCSPPTCGLGKGNHWGLVALEDCRECLRSAGKLP